MTTEGFGCVRKLPTHLSLATRRLEDKEGGRATAGQCSCGQTGVGGGSTWLNSERPGRCKKPGSSSTKKVPHSTEITTVAPPCRSSLLTMHVRQLPTHRQFDDHHHRRFHNHRRRHPIPCFLACLPACLPARLAACPPRPTAATPRPSSAGPSARRPRVGPGRC